MAASICAPTKGGSDVVGVMNYAVEELEEHVPNFAGTPTKGESCWFGMLMVDVDVVAAKSMFSCSPPKGGSRKEALERVRV